MSSPQPTEENVVEVRFSPGLLRQPGLWGKILQANGGIIEYDSNPDQYDITVVKTTRQITLKGFPEGSYLIMGVKGFHSAGILATCYILLQLKTGQSFEWQVPVHLARFDGKNVLLINQSETDLQPIYQSLTEIKYAHLARLQDFLRREKKDPSAPPSPRKS